MSETPPVERQALGQAAGLQTSDEVIQSSLQFVRKHLNMEIAYLSEFVDDEIVFRAVDAPGFEAQASPGTRLPVDQVYCRHILAGTLPELIPDTELEPATQDFAITKALPIRSHVSVPILRRDGSPYGMFCCLSREPQTSLNPRDLDVMRAFANLSAEQINEKILQRDAEAAQRARLRDVIAKQSFEIAYQPIFNLETGHPAGFEALTRFAGTPYRPPNLWFDEAREAGVQSELEIAVIEVALGALAHLPSNLYVSVNASPATVETGALPAPFRKAGPERILLEVTEHAAVGDYDALLRELSAIRVLGTRFAVDDAGAGYSGLQHIIQLRPDIIKLDISLTAGIHQDIARRSLAAALVAFATETNAHIVAEGIEERAEFETLRKLGITYGQGYLLGRPQPLSDARKLTRPEAYRKRA